jgi:hypothetical protein
MPINFRATGAIPDGSITSAKLADNAVINSKIADDAISTTKIQDDAVSTDKVVAILGTQHFLGYETELAVTGTTETSIGEFNFTKSSTATESWKSLGFAVSLKSSNTGNIATFNLYIDGSLITTDSTNQTTYQLKEDDAIDISALTNDKHLVEVKLVNDQVSETATINKLDIYLGKKAL